MGLFGLFGKKENEDPSVSLPMTEKEKFVVGTYALWSEYCGGSAQYIGGYLTREEAMELALKAAREIQKHYNSWEEYYQAYIEGTASGSNVQDSIAKFQPILEKVRGMADGPFSVDWNTAL